MTDDKKLRRLRGLLAALSVLMEENDAPLPWLQLFKRDFVHGTRSMPKPVIADYLLLLIELDDRMNIGLPADKEQLAKLLGMRSQAKFDGIWDQHLAAKFVQIDDRIYNYRIVRDLRRALMASKEISADTKARARNAERAVLERIDSAPGVHSEATDIPF